MNNTIKKMKKTKIIFLIIFLGFFYPFHSFSEIIEQQKTTDEKPNFNIFLDSSNGLYSSVVKNKFEGSHFFDSYLNLEVIGNTNNKISYRFTKQLIKKSIEENHHMLDLAYFKYKWNDKLYFLFGKQPFSFGSMEYANESYSHEQAYRYSHVYKKNRNENYIGFSFIYYPIKDHEFQFQIVNDINKESIIFPKETINFYPIACSVSWNWSLNPINFYHHHDHDHDHDDNRIIKNRWSYSIIQENEKKKYWKLLTLGSRFKWKPVIIEADYILSNEDMEKNRSITNVLRTLNFYDHPSVKYGTYLVKLKYNFIPKWNLIAKGVYEIGASGKGNFFLKENKLFQKSYTYYGGLEFFPIMKNDDISFFIAYQNNRINYSLYSMKKENKNDYFILLGFNYRVKMI